MRVLDAVENQEQWLFQAIEQTIEEFLGLHDWGYWGRFPVGFVIAVPGRAAGMVPFTRHGFFGTDQIPPAGPVQGKITS